MKRTLKVATGLLAYSSVLASAIIACLVVLLPITRKEGREAREDLARKVQTLEAAVAASTAPEYVRVRFDGVDHLYARGMGESEAEWATRVHRIVTGQEPTAFYLCTTLSGCAPPVDRMEVCTPCNAQPASAQCEASHAASVAAFCAEFECSTCR